MKTDANGLPVSEGTYGLHNGYAAKIIRTFVDPTKDNEGDQECIANGGYVADMGGHGGEMAIPAESFMAASHGNDEVIAQDGQRVEVGDTVFTEAGESPKDREGPWTIASVYPLGELKGFDCFTIKEHSGSGPDGRWVFKWGQCVKVVKKARAGKASSSITTDQSTPKVGDWIKFKSDNGRKELSGVVTDAVGKGTRVVVTLEQDSDYTAIKKGARYAVPSGGSIILEHRPKGETTSTQTWTTKTGDIVKVGDLVGCDYPNATSYPGQIWRIVAPHSDSDPRNASCEPYNEAAREMQKKHLPLNKVG